ncbi:hypothetical protein Fot_40724 [Forsythia ovata]|uniref:Uncharacterized protein n=1 Tax=Forsythia ovata TaxID=205694 RepID=A0ABD1S8C7_9LAMI
MSECFDWKEGSEIARSTAKRFPGLKRGHPMKLEIVKQTKGEREPSEHSEQRGENGIYKTLDKKKMRKGLDANSGSISLYALWDKGNWYSCAIFMCSAKDNIEMCRSMESVKGMSGVGAGGHHCPHLSAGVEGGVGSDRLSNVVFIGESKFSGTWGERVPS